MSYSLQHYKAELLQKVLGWSPAIPDSICQWDRVAANKRLTSCVDLLAAIAARKSFATSPGVGTIRSAADEQ